MSIKPFKLSVLDLAPIPAQQSAQQAFKNSLALAQYAEKAGFHRYWLAEHHNMPGIASAATSVLLGYLAANTQHLRLGSGGVMLPNHAPLVIAEQFGTLESLYPGRIDLGLGRAPGSDPLTMRALRRNAQADTFPGDVRQLLTWFDAKPDEYFEVRPIPGVGLQLPVWLLGSSLYSAQLAAQLGLPFAFASHFAPEVVAQAISLYRESFIPSERLSAPYVMMGINAVVAENVGQARYLFTSQQQQFVELRRGTPGRLPPPVPSMDNLWTAAERFGIERSLSLSLVGDKSTVSHGLRTLQQQFQVDEFIVNGQIFDNDKRINSYALTIEAWQSLQP